MQELSLVVLTQQERQLISCTALQPSRLYGVVAVHCDCVAVALRATAGVELGF